MLIGLLSDTHDDLAAMTAAMRVLTAAGAGFFIHAGDVGGEQIIDLLAGLPSAFVWGNNDLDRSVLARYAESVGVRCLDTYGEIELEGKRLAVTHGDDGNRLRAVLKEQRHDYLITGHTHFKRDERVGNMRWINPGALYRARQKSVALLDLKSDELRFIPVE